MKQSARRAVLSPRNNPRTVVRFLSLATVLVVVLGILFTAQISHAVFLPLIVTAGLVLSGRPLVHALVVILCGYFIVGVLTWYERQSNLSVAVITVAVFGLVYAFAGTRSTMGVPLSVGASMLKDLRHRLDRQALVPELPDEFRLETCVLPARGDAFSGDFVVSAVRNGHLSIALTDVSGNGPSAGMRALLLSGALSGLLGETAPENFLPAANRYLIRQGWRDGFASALHVSMNVETGRYCLGTAGHPTAAQFHAGSRRWEMVGGASGLLLGLFEQEPEDYVRAEGVLEPGDVLVLYTDGVVEGPGGDLAAGTHQMLAMAQAAIGAGLEGSARRICTASARTGGDDDRSVVVLWRAVPESHEGAHLRSRRARRGALRGGGR